MYSSTDPFTITGHKIKMSLDQQNMDVTALYLSLSLSLSHMPTSYDAREHTHTDTHTLWRDSTQPLSIAVLHTTVYPNELYWNSLDQSIYTSLYFNCSFSFPS